MPQVSSASQPAASAPTTLAAPTPSAASTHPGQAAPAAPTPPALSTPEPPTPFDSPVPGAASTALQAALSAPKRGRGRPTIMDQEVVSRIVLDLWDRHGYANVGWQDIADAAGVSVRTLTRHFPSKSSIAWVGAIGATEILAKSLLDTDRSVELNDAIYQAIVRSVEFSGYGSSSRHSWIKAVAYEPELVSTAKSAFEPWIDTLADYLGTRLPALQEFQRQAIAQALQAATFAALLNEAVATEHTPASEVVALALKHIRIVP